MKEEKKLLWIKVGYELFSKEGPKGLKVEVISKKMGKNKSSFYHYFANIEVFIEILLDYHLVRAKIIVDRESECKNVIPDLLLVLVEFKQDLLFNRQLRIHRDVNKYKKCFEKSSNEVGEAILSIWAEGLGLKNNSYLALMVLKLSLENFYLQITEETLTYEWLFNYVTALQLMVHEFKKAK